MAIVKDEKAKAAWIKAKKKKKRKRLYESGKKKIKKEISGAYKKVKAKGKKLLKGDPSHSGRRVQVDGKWIEKPPAKPEGALMKENTSRYPFEERTDFGKFSRDAIRKSKKKKKK
jgi:hypothetical protein|tara:strand:- start:298 stop:642 length:345 start_codon:yes stop_codon:yes gene_type:complete